MSIYLTSLKVPVKTGTAVSRKPVPWGQRVGVWGLVGSRHVSNLERTGPLPAGLFWFLGQDQGQGLLGLSTVPQAAVHFQPHCRKRLGPPDLCSAEEETEAQKGKGFFSGK